MASSTLLEEKFRTRISPFVRELTGRLAAAEAERLLFQFTPDERELAEITGFSDDPLREDDTDIHPFPDVVHKYRSKILYLTTDECPVYCRYCTRKRKTLLADGHAASTLLEVTRYVEQRPEINEVIFSGGDPLMLPPGELYDRAAAFLGIHSVRFLRLHSRAITTAPRLAGEKHRAVMRRLGTMFPGKTIAYVIHVNTAAEISTEAIEVIANLRLLGIPLYAQSVLLKGVNDNPRTLSDLCQRLTATGVQPYYLHQLDRVTGSAHFEVSDDEARGIYNDLRMLIPPYMLPRLVRDSKQGKYPL